ncbi:MAG: nicotinate-nucleotide adenylyltransferase [Fimbriiglobus sp.]|jgi:nicotinate-nucleotide adenylyltransferase|nr:nicotinate-nucleotide adenylyltransferase [Fimbriiglobus sp.]
MKIGIFGGTFDPPHLGHLILAERCREMANLDEVWFLVSYSPPHKQGQAITRFEQRCDMVALATTGQPAFRVEPIEKELPPPSYTARTLAELKQRHPEHTFALIVGGDSVHDLPTWFEPAAVLQLAELVAVPRPGATLPSTAELATKVGIDPASVRLTAVECPQVDIASRDIRRRVGEGKSVRYLLPRAVEEYVRERRLYRSGEAGVG